MTSWKEKLLSVMLRNDDYPSNLEMIEVSVEDADAYEWRITDSPPSQEQLDAMSVRELLDVKFDDGYGTDCPIQFVVWTRKWIYTTEAYDGSDYIKVIRRNPPTIKFVGCRYATTLI